MSTCIVCNKPLKCPQCGGSGGYYVLGRDNVAELVECEYESLSHKHTRTEKKHARLAAWAGEKCAGNAERNEIARYNWRMRVRYASGYDVLLCISRRFRNSLPKDVLRAEHAEVMSQLRDRTALRAFEAQERTLREDESR